MDCRRGTCFCYICKHIKNESINFPGITRVILIECTLNTYGLMELIASLDHVLAQSFVFHVFSLVSKPGTVIFGDDFIVSLHIQHLRIRAFGKA